ncbi:DMC1-like protein [Histoplasma capsulatum G186AR]|uniref:DMC1-like protein n=1 Tax=Ajellomyces capsulatus TaxID=5037 RepID=A0A8H8CT61_AJECA|nr:DMC1-like protein [Histoplasma capsulatum]QSS71316.1 DMC1-like protein [Histoplasma capsulatum G186AR]
MDDTLVMGSESNTVIGGGTGGGGGGFIASSLPSPPASSVNSNSTVTPSLPQQRKQSLRPGSAKEMTVINFVDSHIIAINRRHAKKFSSAFAEDECEADRGYENFREVAKDMETIVDVLWVSGTRKSFSSLLLYTKFFLYPVVPCFHPHLGTSSYSYPLQIFTSPQSVPTFLGKTQQHPSKSPTSSLWQSY